ncbi:hypothetical protein BC567DRAFT_237899, partial [Phyllosticta citribraziliensis]
MELPFERLATCSVVFQHRKRPQHHFQHQHGMRTACSHRCAVHDASGDVSSVREALTGHMAHAW